MSRKYDNRTTTFTPEGRLMQVEYACEAINRMAPTVAMLTTEGIILGSKRQVTSKLLEQEKESEKMYMIDEHLICSASGLTSDANLLIELARRIGQNHLYMFGEPIPVEQLVQMICEEKHVNTQFGSNRPYGISFFFGGYDHYLGFQLYCSDPSGNYSQWKAHCIGANNVNGQSLLKEEYNEELSLKQGLQLTLKVLCKTTDTTNPKPEDFELVSLSMENDKMIYSSLKEAQIRALLEEVKLLEKEQ